MRYLNIISILIVLASYVVAPPAAAETRYVVDELVITLRLGKSPNHKILKNLKTGTPLEVLEDDDKTYIKVQTPDGTVGYVLRQYISSEIPKKQVIEKLEKRNSSLQKKISNLEATKGNLEKQLKTNEKNYNQKFSEISATSADLKQKLEQALNNERIASEKYTTLLTQAENVVEIAAERDQLLQKNLKLEADVTMLVNENDELSDSRMVKWFLAGGGVLFFGWIIGKISRKKRSRL
jgi:SH3 domain protein